mgnify:CR=1 FL=1
MKKNYSQIYFQFPINGSRELHKWLDAFNPILQLEVANTLEVLHHTDWSDQEDILVYLHNTYMYRFTLPVLEAACGREKLLKKPQLVQFQLLSCLFGRFLDDLIDRDSGFWEPEQALFWYSHFFMRCMRIKNSLHMKKDFDDAWGQSIYDAMTVDQQLYQTEKSGRIILKSEFCPMPVQRYSERVPYFFCLPLELCKDVKSLEWIQSYINALFFLYDIDDSINDIMRNVATEPAYMILAEGLDNEGRFKMGRVERGNVYQKLRGRAKDLLITCRNNGRSMNLELGPAMIDAALHDFGIEG